MLNRFLPNRSLGAVLDANKGVGPGFHTLRVGLAISVVIVHSVDVTTGVEILKGPAWVFFEAVLPLFFALSGFLVMASAQRLPVGHFLINRGMRLFPALAVEVVLSAFILGPLFTSLPWRVYFDSQAFWLYMGNIFAINHYFLPGVFLDAPHAGMVNASIWTIPWELFCYAIITGLMVTGFIRRARFLLLAGLVFVTLPALLAALLMLAQHVPGPWHLQQPMLTFDLYLDPPQYSQFHHSLTGKLKWLIWLLCGWNFRIMPFFVGGALLYAFRYRVPFSWLLGGACLGFLALTAVAVPDSWDGPLFNLALLPVLTYLAVLVGLTRMPDLPVYRNGDYSYGIYLYGFPIQQVVTLLHLDMRLWWLNVLVSVPLITLFAMMSWRFIEHPVLRHRKTLAGLRFGAARRQRLRTSA
jgi:peptidoglycan/LPS O-acetylase OafA/YrhL